MSIAPTSSFVTQSIPMDIETQLALAMAETARESQRAEEALEAAALKTLREHQSEVLDDMKSAATVRLVGGLAASAFQAGSAVSNFAAAGCLTQAAHSGATELTLAEKATQKGLEGATTAFAACGEASKAASQFLAGAHDISGKDAGMHADGADASVKQHQKRKSDAAEREQKALDQVVELTRARDAMNLSIWRG